MSYKCESCKWYSNYKPNFQYCHYKDSRTKGDNSAKDCHYFKPFKMKPNARITTLRYKK